MPTKTDKKTQTAVKHCDRIMLNKTHSDIILISFIAYAYAVFQWNVADANNKNYIKQIALHPKRWQRNDKNRCVFFCSTKKKMSLFYPQHHQTFKGRNTCRVGVCSFIWMENKQTGSLYLMPFDRNSTFYFNYRNINDVSLHKNINK